MAQLTDAVRALLGHSVNALGMEGMDLLGCPASHSTRTAQDMGVGIPVGGGFLGSSYSKGGFDSCGHGFGQGGAEGLGRGGVTENSSIFGGGLGSSSSGGLGVRGAGSPWGSDLFSPWQGCSIQGHAQGHACHVPLCSSSRLRMIHGIAPVPHTHPPPLPPSSEPTPSLRRHEVVPPWASSSATTAATSPSPAHAAVERSLTAGTLHPVLGAASNHLVGFLPEWTNVEASVVAGMRRVRALLQQQGAANGSGQRQLRRKHRLGKSIHTALKKKKMAAGDGSLEGSARTGKVGWGEGARGGEVEEEVRQRDAEDGQWWHNLRFTLCMLRRALSKDELARGALVVYVISPSPEPCDVHRCCMEAAACLSPPPSDTELVHAPSDAAADQLTTQPQSNAPTYPPATQPHTGMAPTPSKTRPPESTDTAAGPSTTHAYLEHSAKGVPSATDLPSAKGLSSNAHPSHHLAAQPSPPMSAPPSPPPPRTQTAVAAAAAAAAWCGCSLGVVEAGSALGPSFHISDASLPVAGMLVQVLLPSMLHDPTSRSIRAAALSICNSLPI
ncbi:hypothetical protein DUNSADRAFT_2621 [Dunaliella salina]|uniref:Uncharacterized protein n=1 Tax=Dunaliella salina TaxID=3046 RepID=A0ABQ7GVB6_DUNSA|nr:hypothetical protein DUNSADRAFT_2621 [Dunaliella salina]|eukprot:KAF5838560.1 hypothetical protein DUNSADRAFT_2621 [Dunaliella salina]